MKLLLAGSILLFLFVFSFSRANSRFASTDSGLVPTSCDNPYRPIPIFLGDQSAGYNTFNILSSAQFNSLDGGHGHGGGFDPNENYQDTTKWSLYPQKSQNAHIAIGIFTCFTLYIWFCNVCGYLQLSKAFLLTGIIQITQGVYLLTWIFYLLHPQDLTALWDYSLHDVMELQHVAISTCLLVTGIWDFITGWLLHFQIPLYIDSYSRQIQRNNQERIKQPNNLLFWQRYIPVIITIGHVLNGANFIKHPQHSDENTLGHVILGLSMMLGGFCFYWVRVRHKVWRHLTQEIYPNLSGESHISLSTTTPSSPSSTSEEIWNVGARYSVEDLQTLGALHNNNHNTRPKSKFSLDAFDIFAFDTTPPPPPQKHSNGPTTQQDNEQDSNNEISIGQQEYRSSAQSRSEWNGSILDVEYRKHLYPHLNAKFEWNSVSTSKIINLLDNSRRFMLHHLWYTKTSRELISTFFAAVATFNFIFIAWLLMTFIEPPEPLHFTHYYECFAEMKLVQVTLVVNTILTSTALVYVFLLSLHYQGLIYIPSLYKISFFQK